MFGVNLEIAQVAFDTSLEGIIITDGDANIVMINMAVENIFGYKSTVLIGQSLHILIPNTLQDFHLALDKSYDKVREIKGIHKEGRKLLLELRLTQFTYNNQLYTQVIITDITKSKEKENKHSKSKKGDSDKQKTEYTKELEKLVSQLRESNQQLKNAMNKKTMDKMKVRKALDAERELGQLKTKFLSLASHEFRTPLSGILTSATLIDKYIPQKDVNVKKHLTTIKKTVNHLTHILDDFLSLDRMESGQVHYKFSSFGLNKLIKEIIKVTSVLLKNGQIITYNPCLDCTKMYQDKKIVHIILSNIIYNAIKYSPENTSIDISVEEAESITIKVVDQGIGIPLAEQKNIFSRFYRASNVSHIQGTGIGLNIVKANVQGLGGSISFNSKENVGTTFIVKLPKNVSY